MAFEDVSGRRLGAALREARMAAGLSRREVADRAGCTTRQVRAFERGETQPDDAQMERLAMACTRPVDTLLPARGDAPVALEDGRLHVGTASRELATDEPLTDDVLRSYLGALYELRDSKPGAKLPLRDRDLDALAGALGSDPDVIETRLVELMDVTREEAAAMRAALFRRRVLVPAATIALGATMVAGGASLIGGGGDHATKQATVRTDDTDASRRISIGTAAVVSVDSAVEIGDAATVTRDADATAAAAIPVEVDAAPSDPMVVTRDA